MSSCFEFNINDLEYLDYDDSEVEEFESLGAKFIEKVSDLKKKIVNSIKGENARHIKEHAISELEDGEEIIEEFSGYMDGRQYVGSQISAEYAAMPLVGVDIGLRCRAFVTDRKVLVYEVGYYDKIMREYVIENKDISRALVSEKNKHIQFYAKKDKYNNIRECSSYLLYYYLQGRFAMNITSGNDEAVCKIFRENYKQAKWNKFYWLLDKLSILLIVL